MYFKILTLIIASIPAIFLTHCRTESGEVQIKEIIFKQSSHFKISTSSGTYYLEKNSGGFSSIMDKNGTDWVQFRKTDSARVPESAASDFRGLPNLVHRGEQGGIGHPGFIKCFSEKLNDSTIITKSHSGNYELKYTFSSRVVKVEITRADPSRKYWFLYEGPIAGKFDPETNLIFTDQGLCDEQPDISKANYITGNFSWICTGDKNYNQVLLIKHETQDTLTDVAMFMGSSENGNDSEDGMVVIGFGRSQDHQPLLEQTPNIFKIELMDKNEFLERMEFTDLL